MQLRFVGINTIPNSNNVTINLEIRNWRFKKERKDFVGFGNNWVDEDYQKVHPTIENFLTNIWQNAKTIGTI